MQESHGVSNYWTEIWTEMWTEIWNETMHGMEQRMEYGMNCECEQTCVTAPSQANYCISKSFISPQMLYEQLSLALPICFYSHAAGFSSWCLVIIVTQTHTKATVYVYETKMHYQKLVLDPWSLCFDLHL